MTKLDDLIASARGDEPTPEQLNKLDQRLAPLLVPPGGGGGGGGAAGGGGALALKWIAAGVIAVGGGIAVQQAVSSRPAPVPVVQVAVAPVAAPPIDAAVPPPDAPAIAVAPPVVVHHEPSLAEEAALLDRARQAIQRGDAKAALALCDRHARGFAHGQLIEERERIAIEALITLGRNADAQTRAQRFDRAFPNSIQSERIHALLRAR